MATVTDEDQLVTLFKQSQGFANTSTEYALAQESIVSRPAIFADRVFTDKLPDVAPTTFTTPSGWPSGKGTREIATGSTHLIRYTDIPLTQRDGTNPGINLYTYDCIVNGVNYLTNILLPRVSDATPLSGRYTLQVKIGGAEIANTNYILDRSAGILIIKNTGQPSSPTITFWRYEGETLETLSSNVATKTSLQELRSYTDITFATKTSLQDFAKKTSLQELRSYTDITFATNTSTTESIDSYMKKYSYANLYKNIGAFGRSVSDIRWAPPLDGWSRPYYQLLDNTFADGNYFELSSNGKVGLVRFFFTPTPTFNTLLFKTNYFNFVTFPTGNVGDAGFTIAVGKEPYVPLQLTFTNPFTFSSTNASENRIFTNRPGVTSNYGVVSYSVASIEGNNPTILKRKDTDNRWNEDIGGTYQPLVGVYRTQVNFGLQDYGKAYEIAIHMFMDAYGYSRWLLYMSRYKENRFLVPPDQNIPLTHIKSHFMPSVGSIETNTALSSKTTIDNLNGLLPMLQPGIDNIEVSATNPVYL